MSENFVKIATFSTSHQAYLAKMLLAESEIDSIILGENLLTLVPSIGFAEVELHVPQSKAEQAIAILESHKDKMG